MCIKNKKYSFCIVLLLFSFFGYAQSDSLHVVFAEQLEKRDLSIMQQEVLLDSLLKDTSIKHSPLALAKQYRIFAKKYWKKGKREKAIFYCNKVELLGIEYNIYSKDIFAKNHRNKVFFLYRNEEYYRAIASAEKYIIRYPKESIGLGKMYRLFGNIYSDLGDYTQAFANYDKSVSILEKNKSFEELTKTYISQFGNYVDQNDLKDSNNILSLISKLEHLKVLGYIDDEDQMSIYLNSGLFYDDYLRDYGAAENYYESSLKLAEELDYDYIIIINKINLGVIYKNQNKLNKSRKYLKEANQLIDNNSLKAAIANNQADIFLIEQDYTAALTLYQKAITTILKGKETTALPTMETIKVSPNKIDLLGYLIDKANAWMAFYEHETNEAYLQHALQTFTLADEVIDLIYFESREDLSKLFWREKGSKLYPKAVEVCYLLQQPEKAFYFIEKNKSMLLLENITDANAKQLSGIPETILKKELQLKRKQTQATSDLAENENDEFIDSLKNVVFHHKERYKSFIDSLETAFPKYYNYKKNIDIIQLKEVQQKTTDSVYIAQYILGKEKGFLSLISKDTVRLIPIKNIADITKRIETLKTQLTQPFVSEADKTAYSETANTLFRQLFPLDTIEDVLKAKKVTIIPDGILQYIPFEALIVKNEKENHIENYLLQYCTIHYEHSLSLTQLAKKRKSIFSEEFLACIPVKFQDENLPQLLKSEDEVTMIDNLFSGTIFQYKDATKANFLNAYGEHKIVHLSTHAGVKNTVPWLAFHDTKIALDELYFIKNQSDLVVLSACKTSEGVLRKGEGVMSLSRGFFNAGAKSVVSSLWEIDEKASNEIIEAFYNNMKLGMSKSEALHQAKQNYLKTNQYTSNSSPYYWSGLILNGDDAPLTFEDKNEKMYYLFGGILGLLFLGFVIRRKKRN